MTLLLQHADHAHADAVLADIVKLRRSAQGRALIDAVARAPARVRIGPPQPVAPPNAWMSAGGAEAELSLTYDPRDWPSDAHPGSPSGDAVLARLLALAAERLRLEAARP